MLYSAKAKIELANSSYVPIHRDSTVFYGGSQMWFPDDNKRSRDYILHHYGCGTIATADLFLYLALKSDTYRNGVTESVLQGTDSAVYKDYMSYVRKVNAYYTKTKRYIAVLGPKIAYAFNSYARTYSFGLRARWKLGLSYYDMLAYIEEMLSRDIPVILSIGPNTPFLWRNKGISFYMKNTVNDIDYYQPVRSDVNSHYVTVTGMYNNPDDNKGKIMLCISSWGKLFYINYNEYRDYIDSYGDSFTSSMVYIK